MRLSREEWIALDALVDDDLEPIEQIFLALKGNGPPPAPEELLAMIFGLYRRGFITLRQSPIMDQEFAQRTIEPTTPEEVVGDLGPYFRQFCLEGDYLRRVKGGGVPFGVYASLTESGRVEYDRPEYEGLL